MATAHMQLGYRPFRPRNGADRALSWSKRLLVTTAWLSGAIFALYILAFYIGSLRTGTPEVWNETIADLYSARRAPAANGGIAVHFAFGAVILLLGPVQLLASVRGSWPRAHRIIGWTYASAAILTGLGGLSFIVLRGTVGGAVMNIGFALYGVLTVLSGVQTVRHAVARRLDQHRAWAIRLFALAIGSWLYRMDYGFWFLFAGKAGHTAHFTGAFDYFMDFWFYIPNLILAEIAIRSRGARWTPLASGLAAAVLLGAALFLLLATYFFTVKMWGPAILGAAGLSA